MQTDDLRRLSSSMQAILRGHSETVDASWLVREIIRTHPWYAHDKVKLLESSVAWPVEKLRKQSVEDWYDEARSVLAPDFGELHGRHVIVALALCERHIRREMVHTGLFNAVLQDIPETFKIFGPRGLDCLGKIPRAAIGSGIEPILLQEEGCPGKRAGLSADGTRAVGYAEGHGKGEGAPGLISVWNVESGQRIVQLKAPAPVWMARFTADGQILRALLRDGRLVQWTLRNSRPGPPDELSAPIDGFVSGAISGDATIACARLRTNAFLILHIASGAVSTVSTDRSLTRICISPDGGRIGTAVEKSVSIYRRREASVELEASFPLRTLSTDTRVEALECANEEVAVGSAGGKPFVVVGEGVEWPSIGGSAERVTVAAVGSVARVGVAADGSVAAFVDPSVGSVTLFQPRSLVQLGQLRDQAAAAIRAIFSLDGRRLLITHEDDSIRIWDVGLEPSGSRLPPSDFHSDTAEDTRDLLGRDRDVDAFASLIAARSVRPPLSIGIFADWGGGKSWFMHQLRRRVAVLAADARAAGVRQADLSFHKHIAQVQFNAWHYSETDVMASLVDHVFNRLELGEGSDLLSPRDREARDAAAAAAEDARKAAEKLQEAEAQLAALAAARRDAEDDRADRLGDLRDTLTQEAVRKATASAAWSVLRPVGWERAPDTVRELAATLGDARHEMTFGGTLLMHYLGPGVRPAERLRRLLPLLSLAAAALVVGVVTAYISDQTRDGLIAAGAVAVAATGWVTGVLRRLTKPFRDIDHEISANLKDVDDEILGIRRDESKKEAEVVSLRATHERKVERLALKRQALADVRPEQALTDLLDIIVRSGEYSNRLGLVARARHDLEEVSKYVNDTNAMLERPAAHLSDEDGVKISRIVLYIDDLDRCEPDKVTQVLQAVHLLLAFPLFVVVVGVDPRWVGRALKKKYPELLEGIDPNEYLEKIFQIPFWLENLNDTTTKSMLAGLAALNPSESSGQTSWAIRLTAPGSEADPAVPESTSDGPVQPGTPLQGPRNTQVMRSRDLNPAGLLLKPHELQAMEQLAGILGRSPRTVKRFVNIYRLLKVRTDDPGDFAHPHRADADYLVVLYLLAEATGHPHQAPALFTYIRSLKDDHLVTTVPSGWPKVAYLYKAWLDDVAQFSFSLLGPSAESMYTEAKPAGPTVEQRGNLEPDEPSTDSDQLVPKPVESSESSAMNSAQAHQAPAVPPHEPHPT